MIAAEDLRLRETPSTRADAIPNYQFPSKCINIVRKSLADERRHNASIIVAPNSNGNLPQLVRYWKQVRVLYIIHQRRCPYGIVKHFSPERNCGTNACMYQCSNAYISHFPFCRVLMLNPPRCVYEQVLSAHASEMDYRMIGYR